MMSMPQRTVTVGPDRRGRASIRKRLGVVALAGVLFSVGTGVAVSPAGAIHNGDDVPISSYPFMVSLRLASTPDSPRCGGTLVEADMVLTAAHCVAGVRQGGIVAVVGATSPDWARAPRIETLGHAVPETFDLSIDNRDDIAVVRLAARQSSPTVELATVEPQVQRPRRDRGVGLHQRPAGLPGDGDPPAGQPSGGARRGGVLRHRRVLDPTAVLRAFDDLYDRRPVPVDHQPWRFRWPAARAGLVGCVRSGRSASRRWARTARWTSTPGSRRSPWRPAGSPSRSRRCGSAERNDVGSTAATLRPWLIPHDSRRGPRPRRSPCWTRTARR